MPDAEITPVVARIVAIIGGIAAIGRVHGHDIYDRDDVRDLIVSSISGTDTLRAWWVTGPSMTGTRAEQREAGYVRRRWVYTVHGIEGLTADGDSIETLRTNAVSVADALDADFDLNGTCHTTDPCRWTSPINRRYVAGAGCSYVALEKAVTTISTPA